MNSNTARQLRPLTSLQLEKLTDKFRQMLTCVAGKKDLRLHTHIDQFYYMQKLVELQLLVSILNTACPAERLLHEKIRDRYLKMYCTWKKDVRWLHGYLRTSRSILTSQQYPKKEHD